MTINIFGPGARPGVNETTDRPAQVATGKGTDTWFKDCTSEEAEDGTLAEAQFFNFMIANFRNAVRGMDVPLNAGSETDDDLLLKCFQKLQVTSWMNLRIFPEILESGNVLAVQNNGGGQLEVTSGQAFLHRGWNLVDTSDYSAAERRVTTVANKTYHLRWQFNGGAPIFTLKDVSDGVYNPGALAETSAAFDSTYDDMLIAKVVTNGANAPTITALKNAAKLKGYLEDLAGLTDSRNNGAGKTVNITFNWARQVDMWSVSQKNININPAGNATPQFSGSDSHDHDQVEKLESTSRYGASWRFVRDYADGINVDFWFSA